MAKKPTAQSSGMRGDENKHKGKVRSLSVDVAQNGFSVSHYHDHGSKGEPMIGSDRPKVFTDKKEALDHVSSIMDGDCCK